MKNYLIKNTQSKFNYDFIQRDENGNEIVRKEITSKTTDGYLHLPEIINGRKLISLKVLNDADEFNLDDLPERAPRNLTTDKTIKTTKKINLEEYYTEEEKKEIEKYQKKIDAINEKVAERAKKDIQMAELKAQLMALPEEMRNAMIAMMTKGAEA